MVESAARAELQRLLDKNVDELYVLLAQADPANAEVLFSAEEARSEGERRFARLTGPLHQKICVEWGYCERQHRNEFGDTVTLTAAVADVIVGLLGGIPAGTVATLLVKKGLGRFCGC